MRRANRRKADILSEKPDIAFNLLLTLSHTLPTLKPLSGFGFSLQFWRDLPSVHKTKTLVRAFIIESCLHMEVEEMKKGRVKRKGLGLGLRLGFGASSCSAADDDDSVVIKRGRRSLLTSAQLKELRQQALIFKYITAGLPVPAGLVFPIWSGVAAYSASADVDIYKQFPSFVGFCPEARDYGNLMEPEPGRCRRTDGKKWRCKRNVVPDLKYCEQHMHRGRSRKPVETSQIAVCSDTTRPQQKSDKNSRIKADDFILTPAFHQPDKLPSRNCVMSGKASFTRSGDSDVKFTDRTLTTGTSSTQSYGTMSSSNITGHKSIRKTLITGSSATIRNKKSSHIDVSRRCIDLEIGNCSGFVICKNITNRRSIRGTIKNAGSHALQAQGCSASFFGGTDLAAEPGRCRRTDGKKWRCSREVVMNQKYCTAHMHRGVKKHLEASKPAALANATTGVSTDADLHPTMILPNRAKSGDLNTNLSISIRTSPQLLISGDLSTTSSGSDTTISDTILATYEGRHSP